MPRTFPAPGLPLRLGCAARPSPQADHGTALGRIRGSPEPLIRRLRGRPRARLEPGNAPLSGAKPGQHRRRGKEERRGKRARGREGRGGRGPLLPPRSEETPLSGVSLSLPLPGSAAVTCRGSPGSGWLRLPGASMQMEGEERGVRRDPGQPRPLAAGCCGARPLLAPSTPRCRPHPPRRSRLCRPSCGLPPPPAAAAPSPGPRAAANQAALGPRGGVPAAAPGPKRRYPAPRPAPGRCPAAETVPCAARSGTRAGCSTAGAAATSASQVRHVPVFTELGEKSNIHRSPGVTIQWHFIRKGNLFFF